MKLLIVEDEKELSDSIKNYLDTEQYSCEVMDDYIHAIDKIHVNDYARIVVDIDLTDNYDFIYSISKT